MISPLMGGRSDPGTTDKWLTLTGHLTNIASVKQNSLYHLSPPGTFKNMRILLTVAPGSGKSRTFTLFKGGTDTGITVTISNTDTSGEDLSNTYTALAGDSYYIEQTTSGTPDTTRMHWSLMFDGDNSKESPLFASSVQDLSTTTTEYLSCGGHLDGIAIPTTEDDVICVIPTSGTIKNLYVQLQTPPGVGNGRFFRLRLNKSDSDLGIGMGGSTSNSNNTLNDVSVVAGDRISIRSTISLGTPASSLVRIGLTFVADTDGEFIILSNDQTILRASGTRNVSIVAGDRLSRSVVASTQQLTGDAMDIKNLYVHLSTAPGSGNDYDFRLFKNGSSTALTCNIAGTATTCNHSSTISVSAGDRLNTQIIPTSFPTQPFAGIGYLGFIEPPPAAAVSAMMMGAAF